VGYRDVPKDPCPYFTLNAGHIPILGQIHDLRVPICRCILTEALVTRLRTHPEGEQLASCLEGPPLDHQAYPMIGSDLQLVSPLTCTNSRKCASCQPSFIELLTDFTLDATLPPEE
jgi:hypothetical protein